MHFSIDEGISICIVRGGQSDGEIIFISDKDNCKSKVVRPPRTIEVEDGKFQIIPNDVTRVHFVAGPSGSGKSTWVANYARQFQKLYPKSKIILFSRVAEDTVLADLNYKRIVLSEDLIRNPLQLEEVTDGTLIIFDDVDTISNTLLLKSILNFQSQVLEMGRHLNVKCCITSHLIVGNDRKQARTILNEMQTLTIFPQSGSEAQIRYALDKYFGLPYKETTKLLKVICKDSRWITLYKCYPQIIVSEKLCMFLNQL